MDLALFSTAFILQFIGHRVGDYLFQTDWQAQNKSKNSWARFKHCFIYSLTITLIMLLVVDWKTAVIIFGLTIFEHYIIDSRKPVVGWKNFLEKRIAGNKEFDIQNVPFFVVIEIDQTMHYTRCLLIAVLLSYGVI